VRTEASGSGDERCERPAELALDYHPPLDWPALLAFLRGRAIAGVERIDDDGYVRAVALAGRIGWVRVGIDPARPRLSVSASASLAPHMPVVAARLRALFDLDAQPQPIAALLRRVAARPGLRVPGAFDGFELAARAVLGQQVSVRAATTLCARLVERFGRPAPGLPAGLSALFPESDALARAAASEVQAIGLPERRAGTIVALARAVAAGSIDLSVGADPARTVAGLQALPGVGPWTAQYVAMRALRWPDAFPAGDLVIKRALGVTGERAAEARAAAWRPWRAYAVLHLWSAPAE
jgi:AraC family transcriptional regulator of adaptative response / DNA-3-methyladenine glycosylase II